MSRLCPRALFSHRDRMTTWLNTTVITNNITRGRIHTIIWHVTRALRLSSVVVLYGPLARDRKSLVSVRIPNTENWHSPRTTFVVERKKLKYQISTDVIIILTRWKRCRRCRHRVVTSVLARSTFWYYYVARSHVILWRCCVDFFSDLQNASHRTAATTFVHNTRIEYQNNSYFKSLEICIYVYFFFTLTRSRRWRKPSGTE